MRAASAVARVADRQVAAFAACLVLVAAVAWGTTLVDDATTGSDRARVGERVEMRALAVRVTDVTVADAIEASDESHRARGAFVVVRWTMEPRHEPTVADRRHLELRTRGGLSILPTDVSVVGLANPGFVARQTLVFDVPTDDVAGAELVIPPPSAILTGGYDPDLVVDLGLDDDTRHVPSVPQPTSEDPVPAGEGDS